MYLNMQPPKGASSVELQLYLSLPGHSSNIDNKFWLHGFQERGGGSRILQATGPDNNGGSNNDNSSSVPVLQVYHGCLLTAFDFIL